MADQNGAEITARAVRTRLTKKGLLIRSLLGAPVAAAMTVPGGHTWREKINLDEVEKKFFDDISCAGQPSFMQTAVSGGPRRLQLVAEAPLALRKAPSIFTASRRNAQNRTACSESCRGIAAYAHTSVGSFPGCVFYT